MTSTNNMRPGIFIDYEISPLDTAKKARAIGLAGSSDYALAVRGVVKKISSQAEADELFGIGENLSGMAATILENSNCELYCVCVEENNLQQYKNAVDLLLSVDDVYVITAELSSMELIEHVKARASLADKLFVSGGSMATQANIAIKANIINSPRILLCYPAIYRQYCFADIAPCCLAAVITNGRATCSNLHNIQVNGEFAFSLEMTNEADITNAIYNGVCIFESNARAAKLIRGVTTATRRPSGSYCAELRDISAVYCCDEVKSTLLSALKARLEDNENPLLGTSCVEAVLASELISLKRQGFISGFKRPVVTLDSTDASVCRIAVSITLAQAVSQIYLKLNIRL